MESLVGKRCAWLLLVPLVSGCIAFAGTPSMDPYVLAYRYAPVIHQGAATDQDYITAVDFDGDWIGNNNWENQPIGNLAAYVYYSVVETKTHWFLFYSLFHPRDYERWCFPLVCHENDLESIQLVVRKDGTSFGQLQVMETLAHSDIYLYVADPAVQAGYLSARGPVLQDDRHPIVYVETYGHGIYGHPLDFAHGEVIYRVREATETPEDIIDGHVAYRLISIHESLWLHRDGIGEGKLFDQPFAYRGHVLPATFDGDTYGKDKANTPWGYDQATGHQLYRGDWFLDPARALAYHATFPSPYSNDYLFNTYLADLGLVEGD